MKRIAVIGGGVSGLTAAFALEKERCKGAELECVLFESSAHFGGVIKSERIDGCLIEAGPDSFLTEKPGASDLCREIGLGDQLIGSNDAERKTYILVNGRLVPIPDGMMFMVPTRLASVFFSPLFSSPTKLRIIGEWFYRPSADSADVTVAEFVRRHYGREMVERLADPLLAGVYGGSADQLSVKSVLPRFLQMEAVHGSLGKAMLASRKGRQQGNTPLFTSLRDGMQQLTDTLLKRIPAVSLRQETQVQTVKQESRKWLVICQGRTEEFDAVILSLPAHAAAAVLREASELSAELTAIQCSSSAIVVFAYDESVRAKLPPGFGFLVPRAENRRLIAATFVHSKFPHRAPDNRALIRCFLGGTGDPAVLELPDGELENLARNEMQQILGIAAAPLFSRVYKWRSSMTQYGVGHSERISRIRALVAQASGLAFSGNAYNGIGVPDCVRSGSEAATKVMADLGIGTTA